MPIGTIIGFLIATLVIGISLRFGSLAHYSERIYGDVLITISAFSLAGTIIELIVR